MERRQKSLSAREVLQGVYQKFKTLEGVKEINLPTPAFAEIELDADWHRIDRKYICYDSALIVEINGRKWVIAFGFEDRGGVFSRYDIAAVSVPPGIKVEENTQETVKGLLEVNGYFCSSLLFAEPAGSLCVRGCFREEVKALSPKIKKFVAKRCEINPNYLSPLDLTPLVVSGIQYKVEFVDFLFKAFQEILYRKSSFQKK
jgi:hypothetical protein